MILTRRNTRMRPTPNRILALALVTTALFAFGCAKKTTPVQTTPAPPSATQTPSTTPGTTTPTPSGTPGAETPGAQLSDLATVYFALDSSTLDEAAQAVLDRNAKLLRDNASWTVTIAGHCDERGTVEYNQALGERRAQAAAAYLAAAGVAMSRIDVVSFGKDRPFDEGHGESAWAKNRRAHFVLR